MSLRIPAHERSIALDEAIRIYRAAFSAEHLSHEDQAMVSSNLSIALLSRHEIFAATEDVNEAVQLARQSASLVSEKHPSRPIYLNTLANTLSRRYSRFKDLNDLEDAIKSAREALNVKGNPSYNRAMYVSNLSTELQNRFEALGNEADHIECMHLAKMAVELTPRSRKVRYALYTSNLGHRVYESYLRSASSDRLDRLKESVHYAQICVEVAPRTHTDWPDYANTLGWRLTELGKSNEDQSDFTIMWQALDVFKSAYEAAGASPMQRIKAGRVAGLWMMFKEAWVDSYEVHKNVIMLLSHISPRSLSREDAPHSLSGLSNVSTFAATAALNAGKSPAEAIALLEMGRGLISGLLINSRSDISFLRSVDEGLYQEYQMLRGDLSTTPRPDFAGDIVQFRQEQESRLQDL